MRIYWERREGGSPFRAAVEAEHGTSSEISDGHIDVFVGEGNVFFYPLEYRVSGFSLSADELRKLLIEVERKERAGVIASGTYQSDSASQ